MTYSMGVDIGGTKIAAGIIDEKGNCLHRVQLPSVKTDREAMFEQVITCMEGLLQDSKISVADLEGIGIGVPGKIDIERGVALHQNNLPWRDFPIVNRIKDYFQIEHVVIDNDVFMAAFAEWMIRGGNREETFVYVTISTGISCCIIHYGNIIRGAGFAGEIGYLPVRRNPTTDEMETLEEVASGPGIARFAKEKLSSGSFGTYENDAIISVEQIIKDLKKQQPYAIRTMNEVFDYLAKGLYIISCLLDPDTLVLGGGVVNHHQEMERFIIAALKEHLLQDQFDLLDRMRASKLKGGAGIVGAGLKTIWMR